jgi:hypothetical protein
MRVLSIVLLLLASAHLFSQTKREEMSLGTVISDTVSFSRYKDVSDRLPSIKKSENLIEIRLYVNPSKWGSFPVSILSFNNNKWRIHQKIVSGGQKDKFDEMELYFPFGADSLFNLLVANNVFALVDEDHSKMSETVYDRKKREFFKVETSISDGTYYVLEYKIDHEYRKYGFANPNSFLKNYPDNSDLKNYAAIAQAFASLMNRQDTQELNSPKGVSVGLKSTDSSESFMAGRSRVYTNRQDSIHVYFFGCFQKEESYVIRFQEKNIYQCVAKGYFIQSFSIPAEPFGTSSHAFLPLRVYKAHRRDLDDTRLLIPYDPKKRILLIKRDYRMKDKYALNYVWLERKEDADIMPELSGYFKRH